MSDKFVNEIERRYIGPSAVDSFVMHNSSPRISMANKQLTQTVVVSKPDINRIRSGMEEEYGKYTINTQMPEDGIVRAVIVKSMQSHTSTASTDTLALVEVMGIDPDTGEISPMLDVVEIKPYHSIHRNWGYLMKPGEAMHKLYEGASIRKGEVFMDSPNKTPEGYRQGVELNVALVSREEGIEDGFGIRRGVLDKMSTRGVMTRQAIFGNGKFPLNIYGDENVYKSFPSVGEYIRDDGLIFASRNFDPILAPTQLNPESLRTPDKLFDSPVYGKPGARVIDVKVYKGDVTRSQLPNGVTEQLEAVHHETKDFYSRLYSEWNKITKQNPELRSSGRLLSLLQDAVFYMGKFRERFRERLDYAMRSTPISEWYVEVTYEYEAKLNLGSKLTDQAGGKGVITAIIEDEDMYVDANGDIVDVIIDDKSTIKRMNLSRLFRQAANAAGRKYQLDLIKRLGDNPQPKDYLAEWPALRQFHLDIMPDMVPFMDSTLDTDLDKVKFVRGYANEGHFFYRPVESSQSAVEMLRNIRDLYPPAIGPLTYKKNGVTYQTKTPIMTGTMYFYVLEQLAERWAAVASPKFHHYGVPARLSKSDRHSNAGHRNPTRTCGESEMRNYAAIGAGPAMVELHDQSNNPLTQRQVVRNIQLSERPELLKIAVDRNENPLGYARPQGNVNHILYCMGITFDIEKE